MLLLLPKEKGRGRKQYLSDAKGSLLVIICSILLPGTQENNNSFSSRNLMMEKGKELECTRRAGGLESAKRILMKGSGIREADSDDRGFPL